MEEKHLKVLIQTRALLNELLESRKREIEEIVEQLKVLTNLVEQNSFQTASSLISANTFIEENKNLELNSVSNIKKIFSNKDSQKLLAHFTYQNDTITINFPNPAKIGLTYENYVDLVVKPLLTNIKNNNKELDVKTQKNEKDLISKIMLFNVSFDSFDSIFNHFEAMINY